MPGAAIGVKLRWVRRGRKLPASEPPGRLPLRCCWDRFPRYPTAIVRRISLRCGRENFEMTSDYITADLLVPDTLVAGKYVVGEVLGTGGFATVYRARHSQIASLRVALKVLHAHHADSESTRRRFRREAETAAALQSRFIVRVLDVGETELRAPFIAMEFVDGMPLDALLKQCGRLEPLDVARFTEGVLRALEVAHAGGVVHRDLKPANVFAVEEDGDPPYSRVLDFGIAKVLTEGTNTMAPGTHTLAGQVVCTPQYAAPELLNGKVTPQVDLYALGHMMAELLDGRAPYDIHTNALLVATEHLRPDPVPLGPYTRSSGLAAIVSRACEKDPAQRYQNARDMLDDIRVALPRLITAQSATLTLSNPYRLPTAPTPVSGLAPTGPSATGAAAPRTSAVGELLLTEPLEDFTTIQKSPRHKTAALLGSVAALAAIAVVLFVLVALRPEPPPPVALTPTTELPQPTPAVQPAPIDEPAPAPVSAPPVVAEVPTPIPVAEPAADPTSALTPAPEPTPVPVAAPVPTPTPEPTPAVVSPRPERTSSRTRTDRDSGSSATPPTPEPAPAPAPAPATDPFGNIRVLEK